MKITKKVLCKFGDQAQKIVDEIQDIADECSLEEGESEFAEILWSAQTSIADAVEIIKGAE